jgi:uncharacterized protein
VEYEWDDANVEHIAEHSVEPEDAEETLEDPRRIPATAYNVPGERRQAILGLTEVGRLLYVVYTLRRGRIRVVTARAADEGESRSYWKRRR